MQFVMSKRQCNVRPTFNREHHGEDIEAGGIVDVEVQVPAEDLDCVFEGDSKFSDMIYNADGVKKLFGLGEIKVDRTFDNHIVDFNYSVRDDEGIRVGEAKITKIKIKPGDTKGSCTLKFQVQFLPTDDQRHWLADGVAKTIWEVEVRGSAQKDAFEDAA